MASPSMASAFKRFRHISALALFAMEGACSRMEDKQLKIDGVTYNFPADHVFRFTNPEEGHAFARIRPPGQKYDMVYSEFSKYRRNFQGSDVPLVTGINDRSASIYEQFTFAGGKTVCKEGQPLYSCGLNIVDAGITWSIIFNKDEIKNSDLIRASATKLLHSYRS